MDKVMKTGRKPIRAGQFIRTIIFLAVAALIFQFLTLLYDRPESYRLVDYNNLPENTVDTVVVGASTVYRYYNPMEAWEKYGIASYSYGIAGAVGENTIFSLKDLLKHQKPKVVLIEVRGFLGSRSMTGLTANMYRYIKNYKNPLYRWEILHHYNQMTGIHFSSDQLPYYLTLLMNHENYWMLLKPENWKRVLKGGDADSSAKDANQFMGYAMKGVVVPQTGIPYDQNYVTKLSEGGENSLREILEYCEKIGQDVVLVSSPYIFSQEDMGELNAISAVADEYGVPFLNGNKDFEKIGMDLSKDFYDGHHANLSGGLKYTDYLLDFLIENYDLPDRRGDEAYSIWEKEYQQYQPAKEATLASLESQLQSITAGQATGGGAAAAHASAETDSGEGEEVSEPVGGSDDEED